MIKMAKAVREVKPETKTLDVTNKKWLNEGTNKEEIFSKREIKEANDWLNERLNGVPTETRTTITVGQLCQWYDSGTMYFPWYQRGEVWDKYLKRDLINTLVDGGHIPDMVFAERNGKFENIDGKQRIITYHEAVNNKLVLPMSIPIAAGGGGLFKDASEELKSIILGRPLGYTYLINPTEKICQDTFLRLQQGVKLTVGEIIHGNYGHVARTVADVAETHPINSFLDKERFLNYRTLNSLLMLESKYVTSINKEAELSFVNHGQEKKMFDEDTESTFRKTLNRMAYCLGGDYLKGLSVLRTAVIYIWLRRNEKISLTKNKGLKINDFLSRYYRNTAEISAYVRVNHNTVLNEDALQYITTLQQRRSSSSHLKSLAEHLEEQYELFNKNKMAEYSRKSMNMCYKEE